MVERVGGGGDPQAHLIIIRELPKNNPTPIFKNLDNFSPGAFCLTPSPPKIWH